MLHIRKYAWAALVFSLLGYVPSFGHLFSLFGFIAGVMVYRNLEKVGLIQKATRLFVGITLLSLLAVVFATIGWLAKNQLPAVSFSILAYSIGLVVAWLTYLLHKELAKTAELAGTKLFRISAVLLKISAFTMPILIGFLIQGITQLIIYVAVIEYKPQVEV